MPHSKFFHAYFIPWTSKLPVLIRLIDGFITTSSDSCRSSHIQLYKIGFKLSELRNFKRVLKMKLSSTLLGAIAVVRADDHGMCNLHSVRDNIQILDS